MINAAVFTDGFQRDGSNEILHLSQEEAEEAAKKVSQSRVALPRRRKE
jgi:hypothetical protein